MKLAGLALSTFVVILAAAVASDAEPPMARTADAVPPGCLVPVAVAPGYLPLAHLTVENRRAGPIIVVLEARPGSALPAAELGIVDASTERRFAHALPAGRNALTSIDADGTTRRRFIHVINRGIDTCARRYVWPVE